MLDVSPYVSLLAYARYGYCYFVSLCFHGQLPTWYLSCVAGSPLVLPSDASARDYARASVFDLFVDSAPAADSTDLADSAVLCVSGRPSGPLLILVCDDGYDASPFSGLEVWDVWFVHFQWTLVFDVENDAWVPPCVVVGQRRVLSFLFRVFLFPSSLCIPDNLLGV